jgi:hypothetical protein
MLRLAFVLTRFLRKLLAQPSNLRTAVEIRRGLFHEAP